MELIRRSYAVFYVILLCALANGSSEGKRWKPEELDRNSGGLSSSLQTEGKEKQLWARCRKEMVERNNAGEDFDMRRLERSDIRCELLLDKNIHKATELLPPHIKENLWNCIRKTSLSIPISENKEDFGEWLMMHFGSLFESSSGRRRDLVAESPDDQMAPRLAAPSQSPGPAIATPTHGPSPTSPTHGPSPASSTQDSSPSSSTHGPSPADDFWLSPQMYSPFRPPLSRKSYRPITNASPPPEPDHSGEHSVEKTLFIVAVVAASAAFVTLIALLLCWPRKKSDKVDPKVERKDESPLLTLSLSDFSAGTEKFVVSGNSNKKESDNNNGKVHSAVSYLSTRSEDPNTSMAKNAWPEDMGQVLVQPSARSAPAPPGPPQPPPALASCPPPPPKPRVAQPPPAPPKPLAAKTKQPPPLGPKKQGDSSEGSESDAPKPKLKPFFWDKVNAKPDRAMVWHEINAGSFQFNEEKIESLFGTANQNNNERRKDSPFLEPSVQYIQIIDPKKAQNLSILLRALNVTTEEIIDALEEGNEIPVELIQTLLKMAPTTDEELKLRLFTGDLSELGPAERFLKVLVDIPYAFKRLESLMFMISIPEDISSIKEYFATLEVACNELSRSRLFLKLLEAVLKTGNRMNDGTYRGGAQAFRLDTLLKLSDVKGTDGKTTLLHFVVQEIIRSEGVRAVRTAKASGSLSSVNTDDFEKDSPEESEEQYRSLGIEAVSGLRDELEAVKKAAMVDGDSLTAAVSKVGQSLQKTKDFLNTDLKNLDEDSEFQGSLASFVEKTEAEATWLLEEEKRIMSLVKSTADYFHGTAGKDEGLRLFVIIRDFLIILDKVCKEVKDTTATAQTPKPKVPKTDAPSSSSSSPPDTRQTHSDLHRPLFPAIAERRVDDSSSDDDDDD